MSTEARLHADGSCEAWDEIEAVSVAVWPSVHAWASAWLAEWESERFGSASDFAHGVTEQGGSQAISVVLTLVLATHGDLDQLDYVGAGPLEDLISHHGHGLALLDEIETTARREPLFARAMANVWMSSDVPETVRHRLARFGARDFAAEHAMSPKELQQYIDDRLARGWSQRAEE